MTKMIKRNAELAARVQKTAELTGFSKRYVRMVINGECVNEYVMQTYMFLYEGENKLMKAVKRVVKFS